MNPVTIQDICFYVVALPLVEPLRTSFGVEPNKVAVLVEAQTAEGAVGWGEISVKTYPGYGPETIVTAAHILERFLIPRLLGESLASPTDVPARLKAARGHAHTKAGLEMAVWDAFARQNGLRLADLFAAFAPEGHTPRPAASVGVSIGIQPSLDETLAIIRKRLDQGYRRIKLKIKRGWDVDLARGVREALPDIPLMLDANSDYTLVDALMLRQLDAFNLLMIEQPLGYDDIYEHSLLQSQLTTPICLDESIHSAGDLQLALHVGALKILNLKPARVGGFTESLRIYRLCVERGVPLWIGGMLETGIGRAANVAFASLPGVSLPSDISATDRYFAQDVSEPPFVLGPESALAVPEGVGSGVEVQRERVEAAAARWREINPFG